MLTALDQEGKETDFVFSEPEILHEQFQVQLHIVTSVKVYRLRHISKKRQKLKTGHWTRVLVVHHGGALKK